MNEIKGGKDRVRSLTIENLTPVVEATGSGRTASIGSPRITFTGFLITGNQNHPRSLDQDDAASARDDLTYSFNVKGRR